MNVNEDFLKWEAHYQTSLRAMYRIFRQRISSCCPTPDQTYPYGDFALFVYKNTLTTLDKRTHTTIHPRI